MVLATTISIQGVLAEIAVPARTPDVLEWLRKKFKQPGMQFQGKIVHEAVTYAVFASPTEDEDESTNGHMLPSPFSDDSFQGTIALMKSKSTNTDEYDKPANTYLDLLSTEYDEYYASCTFDGDDDEDAVDDEEEKDAIEEEDDEEDDTPAEKEEMTMHMIHSANVFIDHPLRSLVQEKFDNPEIEIAILKRCIADAQRWLVDIDWDTRAFREMYRGRSMNLFQSRTLAETMTPEEFVATSEVDRHPMRWTDHLTKVAERDKALYSRKTTANILMYCSGCKKKTNCDYYQMQTRSADEPMTTFVTCLECDKRWKF